MDYSWIPQTQTEWLRWLSAEEAKTTKAYLAKPASLIGSYRSEIATTKDYEGREILELLQNAADQARETSVRGRVAIELLPEGLIIANNGAAFSVGGVLSLENAYLSPKRHKRRQFIGNKGLGFRSVLNWTRAPMILSGSLNLAYSRAVSEAKLKELLKGSQELAELVSDEHGGNEGPVIPVLPFPGYSQNGDIKSLIEDTSALQVLDRCLKWREMGYTTAIGMPFDDPGLFEAARKQIETLRPEILLFVDHLDEVRFLLPEEEERIWALEGNDDASMVMDNHKPLGIWQVHRTQDEVPEDLIDNDQNSPLSYELTIAVPEVETLAEFQTSPLFSHFPTTITLPLPVVCHATLELDQSRNHAQARRSNRYVLEQLAAFLAEVAETRARRYAAGVKAGFRILMELETYPGDLKNVGFPEKLMAAAEQRAIVPALDGRALHPEQAHLVPGASCSWLPKLSFAEVVPVSSSEEEYDFFKSIGVEELNIVSLRKRLLATSDLSCGQRADLITGLIENDTPEEAHSSALLLAPDGQPIPDNSVVFISPKGGALPALPDWVTLWFLNDDLRMALMQRLAVNDVRDLQNKLSSFGLREYSLSRLIRRLISAANLRKKERPKSSTSVDRELLGAVYSLYLTEMDSGKPPAFPDKTNILLPTQSGRNIAANTLYIGHGYSSHGNIVQALYENWSPDRLVTEPDSLGLIEVGSTLTGFLRWLGVATWPRKTITNNPGQDYVKYLLDNIHYPAKFGEYSFNAQDELHNVSVDSVQNIDGLDTILEQVDPMAITAWLALDERALEWSRRSTNFANLKAIRGRDYKYRYYEGALPSYIRWKLETTEWLLDKDRKRLRPKDCVLGERAIESLFPRPARPDPQILTPYGISNVDVVEGWRRGGVLTSLAELNLDDIYARLLELPERQPDGKSARSLYRWLLDAADAAMKEGGSARERFFSEGLMWGHCGDENRYYPVSELHHADSEGLPDALLKRLNIVDLPHRVGAEKVRRVFGVEPIDRVSISQELNTYRLAKDIDPEFQQPKPFFFQLRSSQSSHAQHLGTLKRLSLKVCSELSAEMEYEGDKFEFDLPIWGWLIDEDVLYIRANPTEVVERSSDLLADSIGVAIASIFRIGDGGEFARMFLCHPKNRKALLRRMRGEAANEDMDRIIEEFGQKPFADRIPILQEVGPIEEPVSVNPDDRNTDWDEKQVETVQPERPGEDATHKNPEPLSIEPVEHQPTPTPTTQKIRIQRKTRKHSTHTTTHRVTDAEFSERKVMEFEVSVQPPRYPLLVGQLMGTDAPGCDVLSFGSAGQRDKFKSGEDRDLNKVSRFIEVKGRKHEGAEIELRGNEKDAAVKYANQYYLYRLFKSGENCYTLSILRNPLASQEALEAAVYVHLNRASKMEVYELSGGMAPTTLPY